MTSKKLPHHINTEDLLNALETAEEVTTEIEWKNDVPLFLSKYKIEPGVNKVPLTLLYKLYYLYSAQPVKKSSFVTEIRNYLTTKTDALYLINMSASQIMTILNVNRTDHTELATTSLAVKKHFDQFLQLKGIKTGTSWVKAAQFYEIYRLYCIDFKRKTRLTYENFVALCSLYFKYRRIGQTRAHWFGVNESTKLILSPEDLLRVKNGEKKATMAVRKILSKRAIKQHKRGKTLKRRE